MKESETDHGALRCRACYPLRGEDRARGMQSLSAPLERIDDAVIVHQQGRVTDILPYVSYNRTPGACAEPPELDAVVLPGLVNCHSHLEISHMAGQTAAGQGFVTWLRSLISLDADTVDPLPAIDAAAASMAACGTALVGDISSRNPQSVLCLAAENGVGTRIFLEMIGYDAERARNLEELAASMPGVSLAGHAFYTTSTELMRKLKDTARAASLPYSIHLAEHADEEELLLTGQGDLAEVLAPILPKDWLPPGKRPVPLARDCGLLDEDTLAVHCVMVTEEDAAILGESAVSVCLCPRSNRFIGVGEAPVTLLAESGVALCLGTDSLASNTDLDLWEEVRYLAQKNILPPEALPRLACSNGAHALGRYGEVGTLASGAVFCYSVLPDDLTHLLP